MAVLKKREHCRGSEHPYLISFQALLGFPFFLIGCISFENVLLTRLIGFSMPKSLVEPRGIAVFRMAYTFALYPCWLQLPENCLKLIHFVRL